MSPALLILVAALIAANAFFVIAEYTLVRSRRPRLEAARDEGRRGAALALRQIDNINEYISTSQVGITMASIAIGALGEPAIAHLLEKAFGSVSHAVSVTISVIIAYVLITSAQSVVGDAHLLHVGRLRSRHADQQLA